MRYCAQMLLQIFVHGSRSDWATNRSVIALMEHGEMRRAHREQFRVHPRWHHVARQLQEMCTPMKTHRDVYSAVVCGQLPMFQH